MNEKCTIDQDNSMAQCHREQPVQQRMSAMLMTLFTARKKQPYSSNNANTTFEAVYNSEYTRAGEQWSSNEAASDRSLVWPAADSCHSMRRLMNGLMNKK